MRKRKLQWILSAAALLLAALLFPAIRPVVEQPVPQQSSRLKPAHADHRLRYDGPVVPEAAVYDAPSLTDRLLMQIDPEWLEKYQGSYTLNELSSGDEGAALRLSTAWLIQSTSAPQLGIKIRKEPDGSDFSVSGGRLFLPGPGLGVSYEEIEETDEARAFFEIKRDF